MTEPDYRALLKRSLQAIEQLEAKLSAAERARTEPIAVIGLGCRFPGGADSPEAYWRLLAAGVDAVTEVPKDRWDADAYFDPAPDAVGKSYTKWGGFIDNVDRFDAQFFGISPREAVSLDPQQRLLLEVTWEALEHAGVAPSSLAGSRTAAFVGISGNDYVTELMDVAGSSMGDAYSASGGAHSVAAGRLSYFLGLHGPNAAVDTACSSSLVAVHLALQSLRSREANLALAGGVNVTLIATGSILTSRARMMSFEGRCKTFDASADGYVRAEGCGMLLLKRLSDAQRDGDRILAVIRGSAINQDGRSSGLTAPNGAAQESVIRDALSNAGLTPSDISVVEAHGTGTSLGDPIEVNALGRVFGQRDPQHPLLVASVKTNVGHTEAAAGAASIIKMVLALQQRVVPPHLHLKNPNPLIAWDSLPIRVPQTATPWGPGATGARRGGVSSFGFSGTNSHVILEEAPAVVDVPRAPASARLLVLSAQTPAALRDLAERYSTYLSGPEPGELQDIAFTAGHGRSHLGERLALVVKTPADAAEKLMAFLENGAGVTRGRSASTAPEIAFLFTGQGSQFFGMARELYAEQPAFRVALDACAAIVDPLLGQSLLAVMLTDESRRALLDDTKLTQPALFAVEYALAELWRSWGVEPTIVLGHSVGEYVAACLAGVFSLEDGLKLIAHRGRLMSNLPRDGAMAAVFASEQRVLEALTGFEHEVSLGAINGPENTVISGRTTAVEQILARLATAGVEAQRLNVSHAFHSPLMDPMLDELEELARSIRFSPPRIGLISNVTGQLAGSEVATAAYWRRHVRDAVRFADGIAALHAEKIRIFVEVGPSPTLLRMAARCPHAADATWLPSLRKGVADTESMLATLGELYVRGKPLDFRALSGAGAKRLSLPTYAFQREHFWHDPEARAPQRLVSGKPTSHPLLGVRLNSPLCVFESSLSIDDTPWLADHRIAGLTLSPMTVYLELSLAAARETLGGAAVSLQSMTVHERLVLPDQGRVTVQVVVTTLAEGARGIEVHSLDPSAPAGAGETAWRLHASSTVALDATPAPSASLQLPNDAQPADVKSYYDWLGQCGAHYGPMFRGIQETSVAGYAALARVKLPPEGNASAARMQLHPALLDACVQVAGVPLHSGPNRRNGIYVPVSINGYRVYRPGASEARCLVVIQPISPGSPILRAAITLFGDDGELIAEVKQLDFHLMTEAALRRQAQAASRAEWLMQVEWQAAELSGADAPKPDERWLLLGRASELSAGLAAALRERGAAVTIADESVGSSPEYYARLLQEPAARSFTGIVRLPGAEDDELTLEALQSAHRARIALLLAAVPALAETGARLFVVTRGAQAIQGSRPSLSEAPIWSLANVIAAEYPALRAVRLDLDPAAPKDEARLLAAALSTTDAEDRVALRGAARYVARLTTGTLSPPDESAPRRLEIDERGVLENLRWREVLRLPPGPGEIELRVLATGLNFRDVLNALGMYPGDPGPLGNECAGVITAVGEGVTDFAIGDEVVAMIDQSFATYVIAPVLQTVKKPANLTFAEAATIPVTFLTAEYAFVNLSRIKPGERVLVHAATGGVGMAALQLARRRGAEIFATAGSPSKRALALELGAHHVSDSRSLAFVDDVKRDSGGEGVDIVLNSLAGDFIPASLGLLRQGGRFVEIGKTGIWDAQKVASEYPGLEYYPLYLGEVTAADPVLIRDLLQRLMDDFASGALKPLPQTIYPIERAEDAFRFMGQGRHTGKIVLTQRPAPEVRADASYLVTGGLGGLGLLCARSLVERGARHIALVGRRAPTAEARAAIAELEREGATVRVFQGDVGAEADVRALLEQARTSLPPLRGILHAAGSVDDGMLVEQTLARFESVMAPKVAGTYHLHQLTRDLPLDFFVLFSSGAALLGSPGQSNYAAANGFMDALAFARQADGLHALSINWGSWSEVGMAAAVSEQHRRRWAEGGLRMIEPSDGVRMLFEALYGVRSAQAAILALDRARLPKALGPFFQRIVEPEKPARGASEAVATDVAPRLVAASSAERPALVVEFLTEQLVRVLAVDRATRFRTDQSLMELGLDSLMAMELRNRVQGAVKVRLSVADLLAGQTIEQLTIKILASMNLEGGAANATPTAGLEEGSL
jgi:acyl transferase domain-containing protein/NADPH:quinone reductase-like Zn-dependent oxidoreductase/short-subunit dehydrogenase/aryl carrier-like protein